VTTSRFLRQSRRDLEVIFALAKIGVTAVPFDYHWSRQESNAMLKFFAPKAFVIEERHETRDTADLVLDRLGPKRVLFIGETFTPQAKPYEEAISTASRQTGTIRVKNQREVAEYAGRYRHCH
jgi:non-ribosomal peptide synthetase component E (peptide arylation enzyme)